MNQATNTFASETIKPRFENLQLDLIQPDAHQVRKHFDSDALNQLADSIKTHGMVQPIVVKPTADGKHQIIAGERRFRAAQLAGMTDVPTIVREDLANTDSTIIQVIENLQRVDLTLSETVAGVGKLVEQIGFKQTCEQLAKSPAWVSKHSTVAKLHPIIRDAVASGRVTDIEVAHDLNKLHELAEEQAENYLETLAAPTDEVVSPHDMPTRDNVRRDLNWIKKEIEQDQQRELKRTEAEGANATPEAKKKLADQKKEERAKQARAREIDQLHDQVEELADAVLVALCKKLGLTVPKRAEYGGLQWINLNITPDQFHAHFGKVPASIEAAKFTVYGRELPIIPIKQLMAALGHPSTLIDAELKPLTLAEAEKVYAAVGNKVSFGIKHVLNGEALSAVKSGLSKKADANVTKGKMPDVRAATFIKECVVKGDVSDRLKRSHAFTAYVQWAKERGVATNGDEGFDAAFIEAKIAHMKVAGAINFLAVKLKAAK